MEFGKSGSVFAKSKRASQGELKRAILPGTIDTNRLGFAPKDTMETTHLTRLYAYKGAARYAHEHGFDVLTTTLASSRWKDLVQVNAAGTYACSIFPDVTWWDMNWRKGGLQERRNEIIRTHGFYNQLYCGCEFSFLTKEA